VGSFPSAVYAVAGEFRPIERLRLKRPNARCTIARSNVNTLRSFPMRSSTSAASFFLPGHPKSARHDDEQRIAGSDSTLFGFAFKSSKNASRSPSASGASLIQPSSPVGVRGRLRQLPFKGTGGGVVSEGSRYIRAVGPPAGIHIYMSHSALASIPGRARRRGVGEPSGYFLTSSTFRALRTCGHLSRYPANTGVEPRPTTVSRSRQRGGSPGA
jgi:hypothetical protein